MNGKQKLKGKNILLTFDDGFNSNFLIAEKILKKLKIKAIFFVPSDFIKINSSSKARIFIKKNILDQILPSDFNFVKNINTTNLKKLIKNGHLIGAHTKTHANLALISDNRKLKNEIINSAHNLEKLLKIKIKHFAFTYGNYESISKKSLKLALAQYQFIYSSLRGNNFKNFKNDIIKRDAIYLEKGNKLLSIFLSGILDMRYFFQISNINKFIKKMYNK
ncbi:polysaccharide deacetylase family protein [Candidatus Pelagibacter sp. Uisw_127]|uniref:polysaccharide deacetylase family protein n=1 Tax=Candidatus Pelagibacter sp. Uisw_127 TaxID=3230988 RepID=UPI0039E97172